MSKRKYEITQIGHYCLGHESPSALGQVDKGRLIWKFFPDSNYDVFAARNHFCVLCGEKLAETVAEALG